MSTARTADAARLPSRGVAPVPLALLFAVAFSAATPVGASGQDTPHPAEHVHPADPADVESVDAIVTAL